MKEESIAFQIAFLAIQVGVILFAAGGPSTLSGICVRHGCSIVPPKGRIDRMKKSVSKDDVYNILMQ